MALTGHRVICWSEGGEICEPRLESEKSVAEVYKEYVVVRDKESERVFSVFDGYVRTEDFVIIARGDWKRILFYIESADRLRFGISKHEDYGVISGEDLQDLALWLAYLASGAYTPGYSSHVWLFGYLKCNLLREAMEKIGEVRKLDQGDLVFVREFGTEMPKYEWFVRPVALLDAILGTAEKEKDEYISRLNRYADKLERSEELSEEERKEVAEMLRARAIDLVFS